ncbi:MAG TPA: tRNA (cytidine(34)-2'-O)-methyltransferase [Parachlamydiaceae bacterium]|nr:tRNA (cytidine(34)-2'-O)-methyltransferase [Parachlamydiaceae bacterium]
MKIILVEPQIPQNTGNIIRTASVTGVQVILVNPGFDISDRQLKRAGLDYWEGVDVQILDEVEELTKMLEKAKNNFYFFSSKANKIYSDISYKSDDWLIFGSEKSGLPQIFLDKWPACFVTLPMKQGSRCLNLATTTGIAVYEALRQQNFF